MEWREAKRSNGIDLAVLGEPISHSLSPRIQNATMDAVGIRGSYVALRVEPAEFSDCVELLVSLGFRGANVTVPHKAAAASLATAADDLVPRLGVANVLKFGSETLCRNTDVAGFTAPIANVEPGVALVLGSGGAASACVFALRQLGWRVLVYARNREAALRLDAEILECPSPAGCDLVVNATPLGLNKGELPPLEWDSMLGIAYDLAYRDEPTDFLSRAAELGLRTVDGREMLIEQAALSFEWWLDTAAPRDVMREAAFTG